MNPIVERVSAKIYQFPIKRVGSRPSQLVDTRDYCSAALDTCWYHDEAVRQDPKPPRPE